MFKLNLLEEQLSVAWPYLFAQCTAAQEKNVPWTLQASFVAIVAGVL